MSKRWTKSSSQSGKTREPETSFCSIGTLSDRAEIRVATTIYRDKVVRRAAHDVRAAVLTVCVSACLSIAMFYCMPKACGYQSPAYDRACAEMSRGDFDGAIVSFGEAIGFDMNNKDAYMKRGKCFYHLNNLNDAINDFSHILDFDPKNVDAYLWRGTANSRLGNHEGAVRDFLAAVRTQPELAKKFQEGTAAQSESTHSDEGGSRRKGEEPEVSVGGRTVRVGKVENKGAVKDYERAMEIFLGQRQSDELPANSGETSKTGEHRRKPGTRRDDETDTRVASAADAIPSSDDDVAPTRKHGPTPDKDAIKERVTKLNSAIELDDRNPALVFRRARLYERLSNYDRALEDLSRAINLDPMNSQFYLERARIYHTTNQPDLAQEDVKKAQSVDPLVPKKVRFTDEGMTQQREEHMFKNQAQ